MSTGRTLIGSILLALALWQLVVSLSGVPPYIFPAPQRVAQALIEYRALLLSHAAVTALEVALGLMLGVAAGTGFALLVFSRPGLGRALGPLLTFSQALPVFALAPILTLWLGYGLASKVAMATLIIFFPVMSTFHDGLNRTPGALLDLADNLGATPRRALFAIRVPHALPALGSGLKLAAVYAPIGAVIGEWVGSAEGLGYLMLLASGRVKIDLMFAAMLVLGLMSVLLYVMADRLVFQPLTSRFGQSD